MFTRSIVELCEVLNLDTNKAALALYSMSSMRKIAFDNFEHYNQVNPEIYYARTSGGKDSDVIVDLYLAYCVMHSIKPVIIHNRKSNTDPCTVQYLYSQSYPILYCGMETAVDVQKGRIQIDGSRISEADRTNGRSTDFIQDGKSVNRSKMRIYNSSGLFGIPFLYPIYDWSDEEVWMYHVYAGISCSLEYGEEVRFCLDQAIKDYRAK